MKRCLMMIFRGRGLLFWLGEFAYFPFSKTCFDLFPIFLFLSSYDSGFYHLKTNNKIDTLAP